MAHNQKVTDEQLLELINAGLTRQEIATLCGMHVESLPRRMKALGVHAKHAPSHLHSGTFKKRTTRRRGILRIAEMHSSKSVREINSSL